MSNRTRSLAGYAAVSALMLTIALVSWPANSQTTLDDAPSSSGSINMDFDKNKESTATLKVGDQVSINLASNPTTGYMWQLKTPSDLLEKVDNKYIAADTTPGLVGGGGTEVWTFKAVGAGSGQLVFTYKRSWEPDSLSDATFKFQVNA